MELDRFKPRMTIAGLAVLLLVAVNAVLIFLVLGKDNNSGSALSSQDAGGGLVTQSPVKAHASASDEQSQASGSETKSSGSDTKSSGSDTKSEASAKPAIRLVAQSDTDKRYHALRLHGRYREAKGRVSLRVQERIGHKWITYPLPAVTDSAGRFSTFVSLARLGLARVRVVDLETGLASPALTIRVTS
jgi:hypothetical protein